MSAPACSCGASLAPDQRYCLRCGTATAVALASREGLIAAFARPGTPEAGHDTDIAGQRVSLFPGKAGELSLRTATLAFAFVLGTAAWAGAEIASPVTAAPRAFALAPAAVPAPAPAAAAVTPGVATASPEAAVTSAPDAASVADDELPTATTEAAEPIATPASASADDSADSADTASDSADPATSTTPGTDSSAVAATTPILERVVVIATPPIAYDAIVDPEGPAKYLAGELVPKGALLRGFHGVAPTAIASNIALLSGQGPNDATVAGCPSVAEVTPGTIGDDEQAAGSGCRYGSEVFTVADLLGSTSRRWRAYIEDRAAATCVPAADGAPFAATQPAILAFHSLTDAPTCAENIATTEQLATDFASAKTAPAFSYVSIGGCHDGAACTPDQIEAVDASLRTIVPTITASAAYGRKTAVVIVPAHAPQTGASSDRSACCSTRPWNRGDVASAGGGRTGALVLSPLVRPGAVLDEALDQYDVLRTISATLAVRPLGYAGRDEVKGFPRETWEQWTPSAEDDPTATP